MPFLLVLGAFLVVALGLGRVTVGAIRFRPLLRFTPLNAAAAAVLGLVALTVLYAWLTTAGLSAGAIVPCVPLLALVLAAAGRQGIRTLFLPRGPLVHWIAVAGIAATAAVLGLLPVLRTRSYAVDNDVHTYCALAEWLQDHAYGSTAAWDAESPVTYFPAFWQETRYPLGAAFPLALVQAAFRAPSSLAAYPPVAAAGLALAALALVFLARRALRLPVAWSLLAGALLAVVPSAVHWGHHQGFLQQTLALPVLLVSMALLSRPGGLVRSASSSAGLVALLFAFLLLVYFPFVPLFLAAALGPAVLAARRAARTATGPRYLAWLGATVALAAVASLGALVRAPVRIGAMTGAVPGVHVGLGAREFVEVAVGARLVGVGGSPAGVLLLLPLVLVGAPALWRRPRTGSVLAVLALLLAAIAYYSLWARDPWTGATGHTWSLFKLVQWAYPLVLLLQVSGLAWLSRRWRSAERLALAATGLAALAWLPAYWTWSGDLGQSLRRLLRAERPLDTLGAARQRLHALPGGPLFVVNRPADVDPWLGIYAALLAYPRPIVADWEGSVDVRADFGAEPWRRRLHELGREGGPVPVVLGPAADAEGLTELGAGFALLPSLEPRLIQVRNPDNLRGADDRPPYWLGAGRTKLAVFSGAARTRELVVALRGKLPATVGVAVRGPAFAGQSWRAALAGGPETTLAAAPETALPLVLEPGLTRIALRAKGAEDPRSTVLESVRLVER